MEKHKYVLNEDERKDILRKCIKRIKVLRKNIPPKKVEKWVDLKEKFPVPFRLINAETSEGKQVIAWWTKFQWEGFHLKEKDKITRWQKRRYSRVD